MATDDMIAQNRAAGIGFDRPLLLTPGQDIGGYLVNRAGRGLLSLITLVSVVMVLLIIAFVLAHSAGFFQARGVWAGIKELVGRNHWAPTGENPTFGGMAIFIDSGLLVLFAMVIAVPIGLLAAVFLSDICPWKLRQVIKPVIEILAAIPSVTYGFFAMLVVAPILQDTFGLPKGTNLLNASAILAVMAIPTIVSISEDALSAVGRELREAGYALGSTRAEVLVRVVIPAAHSGIIAAVILGIMRAVGETMLVYMASGSAVQVPSPWYDVTQQVRALTATIAAEMGEAADGGLHRQALFALGSSLLLVTFALNLVSEYFLSRSKRAARGDRKRANTKPQAAECCPAACSAEETTGPEKDQD